MVHQNELRYHRRMTYRHPYPITPQHVRTMGPALFGLHGPRCGCAGMGVGPIESYLFSETNAARSQAEEYNTSLAIATVGAGAAAGTLGIVLKSPLWGAAAGALVGFLVYQTQKMDVAPLAPAP